MNINLGCIKGLLTVCEQGRLNDRKELQSRCFANATYVRTHVWASLERELVVREAYFFSIPSLSYYTAAADV